MVIVPLEQGSEAWLAWRKSGITATDAAVLLERSPYKTLWRLWAEKVGFAREVCLDLNPLVRNGRENEDRVRQLFEARVGDILLPACVESSVNPFMRASLDGLTSAGEPAELKFPSEKVWQEVCHLGSQSEAYQLYYCQVQHQLLVTGAKRGFLVFGHKSGVLKVFTITPDEQLLKELIVAAAMFQRRVMDRDEPEKDPEKDLYIPSGEQAQRWIYAAEQYRAYERQIDSLKAQLAELKARQAPHLEEMETLMGDSHYADYCGVMLTRYRKRGRVNYSKLFADKQLQLSENDLNSYREDSTMCSRVTVTGSVAPRYIVDADALAPLNHVPEEIGCIGF